MKPDLSDEELLKAAKQHEVERVKEILKQHEEGKIAAIILLVVVGIVVWHCNK